MLNYKVTNREWNQALPQIFTTFEDAFKAQQEWDEMASIECITPEGGEVVWAREYEDYVSEDAFLINSNVTGFQTITLVASN